MRPTGERFRTTLPAVRLCLGALLVSFVLAACKDEKSDGERPATAKPKVTPKPTAEPATETVPSAEPAGPRYLRANSSGAMVDAFQFPSVPASMVEQEVASASTRSDAAAILRRFGLTALEGKNGQVWMAKTSLVDRLARERVLVVSFRGEPNSDGMRDEAGWIVFLGSTEDDRILKIGSARVSAKTFDEAPIEVDARELHFGGADDMVATWSSCAKPSQKACHTMRAWTMQRGYPELIVDVTGDTKPIVVDAASPPHAVVVDGRVMKFDAKAFAYR